MIKVYVAGPLSTGGYSDSCANIRHAIDVGHELMTKGFAPYVPHYSHFANLFHMRTWQEWMDQDKIWVNSCQALLRLPGESKGADVEVGWAQAARIPVFTTVDALVAWAKGR